MAQLSHRTGVIAVGAFLAIMEPAAFSQVVRNADFARFNNCSAEDNPIVVNDSSVRVIIFIDKSYSMCQNPTTPDGCCTPGDGSGNCMKNDPEDRRIEAAHWFVDTLSSINPGSQVGIVTYDQTVSVHGPLTLNSDSTMTQIHDWIEHAACVNGGQIGFTPPPVPASAPAGLAKSKATYLGLALEAGLQAVDSDFDNMPHGMSRHIIMLTDGAWDDVATRGPDTVIHTYISQFPDRIVPQVYGVFISNLELHAIHGYPEDGCSSTPPAVPGNLERATILTGGTYLGSSTPTTVLAGFRTLFAAIAANMAASVERPFNRQGVITSYRLPTRTEAYFNLLGKKTGSVQPGNPAANRLPDGIYFFGDDRNRIVKTNIILNK